MTVDLVKWEPQTIDVDAPLVAEGLLNPETGEIAPLDDPTAVAHFIAGFHRWRRENADRALALAEEIVYAQMDEAGQWTQRYDGVELVGESRATWEGNDSVDHDALHADLMILVERGDMKRETAESLFATKRYLSASGRKRLERMGGAAADCLAAHVEPRPRKRRALSVTVAETRR